MITNVVATTSTGNATRYLLTRPDGQAVIIGGTMANTDPKAIAHEFRLSESMGNSQLKKPGYHISLSFHPDDESTLSNAKMAQMAEEHFAGLVVSSEQPELLQEGREADYSAAVQDWKDNRAGDFQYLIVRHHDTHHEHAHLIASRVDMATGKAVDKSYDRYRSQMVARRLERQHGLTKQESSWEVNKRENRHRKSGLERIEKEQSAQFLNEINEVQVERLAEVERLVRSLPDGEWGNYRLKTTDKGRSLSLNDKPVVVWHRDNNRENGTSNYGINKAVLKALEDWKQKIKDQKVQQQKMLEAQQKINASAILQLLMSWAKQKFRPKLPEGYRAIDGQEKDERIFLKGDREILRIGHAGLIVADARDDDVRVLQNWHEQQIERGAHTRNGKRLKPKQKKGFER